MILIGPDIDPLTGHARIVVPVHGVAVPVGKEIKVRIGVAGVNGRGAVHQAQVTVFGIDEKRIGTEGIIGRDCTGPYDVAVGVGEKAEGERCPGAIMRGDFVSEACSVAPDNRVGQGRCSVPADNQSAAVTFRPVATDRDVRE